MATIFTKIIKGEIPSYKIFENEHVFAFLDIKPIQIGHALIVSKIEVDYFANLPEPYYSAIFQAALPIAKAIHKATKCERVGTAIVGFEVPHVHYHLIPMWDPSDLDFRKGKTHKDADMKNMQQKILACLD